MFRCLVLLSFSLAGLLAAGTAVAQPATPSRCADCHFARPDAPGQYHVLDWDRSPHGRNNVGCQACHGGDATTFESLLAHRDIQHPSAPGSPLNPRNLPATCGTCHAGPYVAFQDSEHFLMLRNGDRSAPTCVTCHGAAGTQLLSPRALEARCNSCHGPDEAAPRARRAARARELYEEILTARRELAEAQRFIRRTSDPARRQRLEDAHQQAEVPLIQAVHAGHTFEYDELVQRLEVARQRTSALLEQLANPGR